MDIRYRRIWVGWLIIGSFLAIGYRIFLREGEIPLIMGGIAIGVLFLLISRVTGESMGYGDSWMILILGIYLGLWELLAVLTGTFLLLTVVSAAGLVLRKMSRRLKIPFFPFLAAGYFMECIWRG